MQEGVSSVLYGRISRRVMECEKSEVYGCVRSLYGKIFGVDVEHAYVACCEYSGKCTVCSTCDERCFFCFVGSGFHM